MTFSPVEAIPELFFKYYRRPRTPLIRPSVSPSVCHKNNRRFQKLSSVPRASARLQSLWASKHGIFFGGTISFLTQIFCVSTLVRWTARNMLSRNMKMSTLYEILHLIICFSLFYSKHNYFFEIYSICCPTPKLDVESSFGIMVNYLYDKDSFIVQGRAQ